MFFSTRITFSFLNFFGFSYETWTFLSTSIKCLKPIVLILGNSLIGVILIIATWETFVLFREFMKRIFSHKKEAINLTTSVPLSIVKPAFESPLKDSYTDSSLLLLKENTK